MKTSSSVLRITGRALIALAIVSSSIGISSSNAFAQAKPTISVPSFKNETNWWWWKPSTSQELGDALSNELSATGDFKVVERQKLDAVLSEQELAELGLTRKGTGAKRGELTGAQYVVLGRVSAYEEGVSKKAGGTRGSFCLFGVCAGGGERKSESEAYVSIDLRVVNTTTGEVAYSRTVEGRATDKASSSGGTIGIRGLNLGSDASEEKKVPVGKALRAALIESTSYLSCVMIKKDTCIEDYKAKDAKRREGTQDVLKLE